MDSSGAVGLDESPPGETLTPPPLPQPRSHRLFFRSSAEEDSPSLSEHLAGEELAAAGDASASGPATSEPSESWSDAEPDSSTASPAGDRQVTQLLSKRQLKETAEAAVHIGTGMVHTVAAKTELQRQLELYKADADDAKNIGHPLAEIAYRRGDVVGGKLSPDANNLLQSVLGIFGYFAKQINKIGVIREIEAGPQAAEPQPGVTFHE